MSCILSRIRIGGLQMTLRESAASNYTLTYEALCDPVNIGITHLGTNRNAAVNIYLRKVDLHRSLINDRREDAVEVLT